MPRKPAPPELSQTPASQYQPFKSSHLSVPTSPTVPRTPLHPPARLHLRTVLPSPPLSPQYLSQTPEEPLPWMWTCHMCGSSYPLAVTRRCLEDGHIFCSLPTPPSSPMTPFSTAITSDQRMRSRRRRRQPKGCRTAFDYPGWAQYNRWRSEMRQRKASKATSPPPDEAYRENCSRDCDFPSECLNRRQERLLEGSDEYSLASQEWDAAYALQLQLQIAAAEAEAQAREFLPEEYLFSPVSPLSDEDAVLETERRGLEDEANMVDLSIGELRESIEVDDETSVIDSFMGKTKRKTGKSIKKIKQLTGLMLGSDVDLSGEREREREEPNSPLKQEFWIEDSEATDMATESIEEKEKELELERHSEEQDLVKQYHRETALKRLSGDFVDVA